MLLFLPQASIFFFLRSIGARSWHSSARRCLVKWTIPDTVTSPVNSPSPQGGGKWESRHQFDLYLLSNSLHFLRSCCFFVHLVFAFLPTGVIQCSRSFEMSAPSAPPSLPVRAFLFDMDGLLLNTEEIYVRSYKKIINQNGGSKAVPWAMVAEMQSMPATQVSPFHHAHQIVQPFD